MIDKEFRLHTLLKVADILADRLSDAEYDEFRNFVTEATEVVKDNKLTVKFKKLDEKAVSPKYAKPGDAGLDLTATSMRWDADMHCYVYGTGIAVEIPEGYVGLVFPRSSICKTSLMMSNSVGVIDSGYRGEITVVFRDMKSSYKAYLPGDRIAQLIIMPCPKVEPVFVDELSETERGEGGYGSTGK